MAETSCLVCGKDLSRSDALLRHRREQHGILDVISNLPEGRYWPESAEPVATAREQIALSRWELGVQAEFERLKANPSLVTTPIPPGVKADPILYDGFLSNLAKARFAAEEGVDAGHVNNLTRRLADFQRVVSEHAGYHRQIVTGGGPDGSTSRNNVDLGPRHADCHRVLGLPGPPDNDWHNWRGHEHFSDGTIRFDPVPAPPKPAEARNADRLAELERVVAELRAKAGA